MKDAFSVTNIHPTICDPWSMGSFYRITTKSCAGRRRRPRLYQPQTYALCVGSLLEACRSTLHVLLFPLCVMRKRRSSLGFVENVCLVSGVGSVTRWSARASSQRATSEALVFRQPRVRVTRQPSRRLRRPLDGTGAGLRGAQHMHCVSRLTERSLAVIHPGSALQTVRQVLTTLLVACSSDAAVVTAAIVCLSVYLSLHVNQARRAEIAQNRPTDGHSQRHAPGLSDKAPARLVAIEIGRSSRTLYVDKGPLDTTASERLLLAISDASSFRARGRNVWRALVGSLLPEGFGDKTRFPPVVSDDYLPYTVLHFMQNLVHAAASVIATQSMLIAIGVAKQATIGVSAAVQWILKDGLGRIAAIIFGSLLGNRYDADPKRWRMRGDMLYTLGVGTEIATRLVPQYFLLVGTMANAIKSVSYMMRLPTAAAIRRHFSLRENFGDLSAKANSQEVLSMLLGTFVGIGLSYMIDNSLKALFAFYIIYVQMFILFNYWSLRVLRMRTLNLQRTLIVMRRYWNSGGVETCSVAMANQAENFLLPSRLGPARRVRFGCRLGEAFRTVGEFEEAIARQRLWRGQYLQQTDVSKRNGNADADFTSVPDDVLDERYLLGVDAKRGRVFVVLHRDAKVADELQALMHATYLVRADWGPPPDMSIDRVRDGYLLACAETPVLVQRMRAVGWNVDEFVHAGGERARAIWGTEIEQLGTAAADVEHPTSALTRLLHPAVTKQPSSVGSYELLTTVQESAEATAAEESLAMSPWGPTFPEVSFGSELDIVS
jgi:uncharacterized membrane protein YfcA